MMGGCFHGRPLSACAICAPEAEDRYRQQLLDKIAIARVTNAPREEWPAPDRMKVHGIWWIPDPNQEDTP